MELYDSLLQRINDGIQEKEVRRLPLLSWNNLKEKPFLFKEDVAFELGPSDKKAPYLSCFTDKASFANEDEILLIGKDLTEIKEDISFSRIVIIRYDDKAEMSDQKMYRFFRDTEYRRYKVNPEGYMIRANTNLLREGAKVSKEAVLKGISFSHVGKILNDAYHQDPLVKAVKQIYITDPDFDYVLLEKYAKLSEGIIVTLDHILKNLKMDCSTCAVKDICDEIEGMRDIHKREQYKL